MRSVIRNALCLHPAVASLYNEEFWQPDFIREWNIFQSRNPFKNFDQISIKLQDSYN